MKKTVFAVAALFFTFHLSFAQHRHNWKSMKPDERKQAIQQMNPEQRMGLLQQFREDMVVSELEVPQDDQEEFKTLYAEYQEKQNAIKSKFKSENTYENMTDAQAKQQLNESFDIGQQLLDNRKMYADKFMKLITPQQVLRMYQTEGKMRNKILDRKQDGRGNPSSQSRRP